MLLRLLSYGALGLAVLNVGENMGLVEKNRYLTFLPRWQTTWDVSDNQVARKLMSMAKQNMADIAQDPAPAAEVAGKFTDFIVEKNRQVQASGS